MKKTYLTSLSSVTIKDFKYQPTKKTKKEIWRYLNAANLINLDDISDKQKLKDLEVMTNLGQVDSKIIFDIYKSIPFTINNLINANNIYQTFDNSDARALVYQKYLLSESDDKKIEYLFLLEELFEREKLKNIYSKFLVEKINEIGIENVPENFKEIAESRIKFEAETKSGKVKYNDKILPIKDNQILY